MSDEISILPTMLERDVVGYRIVTPPKSKWYEYETFSHEGGVVELTLQYKGGMVVHVEFPVTGSDAPPQFLTTGDVTFNLSIDDDYYDIHTMVPFTVHVYERWIRFMFLVNTTKFLYDYEEEFHISDIHIGGLPNVIGSPNIYPTSGWTSNIEEGTPMVEPTEVEVYYTDTTRDEDFNPVYVTYTLHYTAKIGDRLDEISVTDLRFEPHEAPMWEKAQFFEYYNDGRVVKTAQYGDWDSYDPTTRIDYATLRGAYANRDASATYGNKEWRGTMVCDANDYHLADDTHVYNLHDTLDEYQNSVEINAPWVIYIDDDWSYYGNTNLKRLSLNGILWMEDGAFSACTNLEELNLNRCTHLLTPFNGCTKLKTINAPNLEVIGDDVFNLCTGSKEIILPKCWSLGARAFKDNYISRVSLPSIEELGEACFYGAHVNIRNVYLGGLTELPQSVFEEADLGHPVANTIVTLPNITSVGALAFHNATAPNYTLDLPNVTEIGSSAFRWDEHIGGNHFEAVNCPNVEMIGNRAFEGLYPDIGTELSFPMCIDVGEHAFDRCVGITKVKLGQCTAIHTGAFYNDRNLVELTVTSPRCTLGYWVFQYEDGEYTPSCNPNLKIWVPNRYKNDYKTDDSMGWVYLSSHIYGIGEGVVTLDDDTILSIGDYEWSYLNDLKHVILDNCTSIGDYGFYCDYYLEDFSLPSVETIGDHAFGCDFDTIPSGWRPMFTGTLSLPSAKTIGKGAFSTYKLGGDNFTPSSWYTYRFTSLDAPRLEEMGDYAFVGNSFTGAMNLPRLRSIGVHALRTTAITSLNVPNLVTVGGSALSNCSLITELNLPKVETIGVESFFNCRGVVTAYIPKVQSIGRNAFLNCSSLIEAIVGTEVDTVCTADSNLFPTTIQSIWVKDELVEEYKSARYWSNYANVIKPISERTTE